MLKPNKDDNFSWLLAVLVLLLFCSALFNQLNLGEAHLFINMSLMVTVIIAIWSMEGSGSRWFKPKLVLGLLFIALMLYDSMVAGGVVAPFELVAILVFLTLTIQMAWKQVMFTGDITRNSILGAICIYLLVGLWFGFAYLIVEHTFPGSMKGLPAVSWQENLGTICYYSMVTLTTLGYGDISPAAPLTRFLAFMEAAIGVFYTTVLVASLIGLRLASYKPGDKS